eukprot:2468549-Rhodomonas_salina.1
MNPGIESVNAEPWGDGRGLRVSSLRSLHAHKVFDVGLRAPYASSVQPTPYPARSRPFDRAVHICLVLRASL